MYFGRSDNLEAFGQRFKRIHRVLEVVAGSSSALVFALALGALFSVLYLSSIFSEPSHAHFDKIPTEPKITQLEALTIIENDVRTKLPEVQQVRLYYLDYNFTSQGYSDEKYIDYRRQMGWSWDFEHVKQIPDLLQIRLVFVHANGTVYDINATDNSFEKRCDEPSLTCFGARFGEAAKDRLTYTPEILVTPQPEQFPSADYHYIVDAETGKIVWNSIDYAMNRKPMPNVNYDNRTVRQLIEAPLNPPETMHVDVVRGASDESNEVGYKPKTIRMTLEIDNKIVWKNNDVVAHTVVSDIIYSNKQTAKFESGLIEPNGTYEFVFPDVGTYQYHCDIHPWMTGTVEVIENFT